MIRSLVLGTALALAATRAQAQSGPDDLALTIYNGGTALVADTRRIELEAGEQVVELPGVSSRIQPTTATFLADGVTIAEQNFDFDLLSPEKLMEKAVGEYVEIVRTNPGNGRVTRDRAKVLSVNNGVVVEIEGRIEVLRDDDIPTRVVFPDVPDNLRARPTLSVLVEADGAGSRNAQLSYLTRGLDWSADYVASFDEDAGRLDLQGWATLTNSTQTTFEDADVAVVAGEVAGVGRTDRYGNPIYRPNRQQPRGGMVRAGVEASDVERVGDTYLYPLPGRVTVRANQTKQVGIVDADGLVAEKVYEFRTYGFNTNSDPQSADVRVAFTNAGAALPEGTLRVYGRDASDRSQFLGEDRLEHTPAGSDLSLKIGEAFDIRVQPTVVSDERVSRRVRDVTMRYRVTNATDEARTVLVVQRFPGGAWAEYEVREESADHEARDAYIRVWPVEVGPEGEAVLEFTVRERTRF